MSAPLRLCAMISGGGRTLLNLADAIDAGRLDATIDLVIASSEKAAGVERARDRGLDVRIAAPRCFSDDQARHKQITTWWNEAGVDLVCLCGYLKWLQVDDAYRWRVLNIHPSLLPDFGGQGMYGMAVHRAVLDSGRSISGCTVHFVDGEFDHGPIVLQRACQVQPGDDAQAVADRVFYEECRAYPEAIELFARGRLHLEGHRVHRLPASPLAAR